MKPTVLNSKHLIISGRKDMNISRQIRQSVTALVLVLILSLTTACNGVATRSPQANYPATSNRSAEYGQLARGDSATAQEFGNWVVGASKAIHRNKITVMQA
jgi:hypothetical protein